MTPEAPIQAGGRSVSPSLADAALAMPRMVLWVDQESRAIRARVQYIKPPIPPPDRAHRGAAAGEKGWAAVAPR